ncbi:B-cell CLL/lymphoma 9-like protein [Biomphalaria pfeifferi]|uniref:B-cell CLL/lymphoma 9-like protein n=1 Tax=Biomphalaria pfeifferi TaxID=112525 RepID=A0AAD8AX31_BIOPF|nr:B-cell CLL/lymphoma 9-like protein [Biomphalaria pfeifferi]
MKERVDSTKMLRDPGINPGINGPVQDSAMPGGLTSLDVVDVKAEIKEEDGRKSSDSRPPSRKIPNGDSESTMAVKTEDNNNKRIKVEKKSDSSKKENGKPGSVGPDSQKASPQPPTPQHPSSGGTTPATMMPSQHGMMGSFEPPFMQQQSEIFVFSTQLANQAAESVRLGQCKSIIQYHMDHPNTKAFLAYHMDHPNTKAFLAKNPLKGNNFRQGMPPNMMGGGMKGQPGPGMMRMHNPMQPNWGPQMPQGPGMDDPGMMGPGGMMPNGPYQPGGPGPRMMGGWPGQGCGGPHPHSHGPMGPGGYGPGSLMDMENELMMAGHLNPNISSSQVPDENLTLEQRQHRSKGLAQLTKIHQMLMGVNGQHDGNQPPMGPDGQPCGPSMYPGGPGMMSPQQQAMMSQQQAMMSQGGMMHPHGMMSPQHQHMMAQQGMPPYGPRGPPGMVPGMNGKEQYQAQHDWYQIQREYYMEKQHRMQHMAANRGPLMEPGPPPSYYSSISQKHGGMGPASPNMNGIRMPMPPHGPHGPMGPGMDPDGMGMYGGPPDMCRPPHMGMEPMPGMHGYPPHGMPPQGPMDPGFDPTMPGGMPPVMGPGPPGPGGPRHHGPMRQAHMMGPNGMMPGMKSSSQVILHRAGNPEQFNPETMGGVVPPVTASSGSNNSKPPPSYAQAQKRKRGDDMDDSYAKGNLQQTPSPTKIHYHLSQFEGQELTITKQLNSAFVAGSGGDESNSIGPALGSGSLGTTTSGGHYNSHANSPLHSGPGSNKGPHSNSSQTSSNMANSPAVSTAGPSPHHLPQGPSTPHSSTTTNAGANIRLSHFDPPSISNGVGSAPHTPNSKASSAMSNITSASLANLAKGVENLSNQMQQNMMQGGPFHSIQVQGQMTSSSGGSNCSSNSSSSGSLSTSAATTSSSTSSSSAVPNPNSGVNSQAPSAPSVNNTYIAQNMSISQVNVPPNHPSMNNYVNMQMQCMNAESPHMNMPPCSMQHGGMGPQMGPGSGMMGGGSRPGMSHHMTQSQSMISSMTPLPGGPSPGMGPGPTLPSTPMSATMNPSIPPHRPNSSSSMPPTPPTMSKGSQFTSPPLSHTQLSGSGPPSLSGVTSPSFPITSSSNSSVQIQQKGHNTIQYLPANPPTSQASGTKQRTEIDYSMPRFPSPLHNMDGKNPSSTLQYYPNSSPTGLRGGTPMSSALSAAVAMGPEFANQATIAMHQSASMMRSSSIPDLQAMQNTGPSMPPSQMNMSHGMGHSMGMGPMDNNGHMVGSMMGGPDPMMSISSMRPGHSPGTIRSMPPGMGPGSLECVSPIPGMGGYINNGPSIEQAQAQAQAHAAMMMQGNSQIPSSSPHGPMPSGGPSPLMTHGPMPGSSIHGPMPPGGMPGSSPHHMQGPPMAHGPMSGSMPGPSPHGPMQGPSPHNPMSVPSPHNPMSGSMPPHGHMGHMHGPGMAPVGMPRHPGMGGMRMPSPGMGGMPLGPGQYGGMQYPGYQQDYYSQGPPRGHPRQMMPGMMGGGGQPYGMMPGPS